MYCDYATGNEYSGVAQRAGRALGPRGKHTSSRVQDMWENWQGWVSGVAAAAEGRKRARMAIKLQA